MKVNIILSTVSVITSFITYSVCATSLSFASGQTTVFTESRSTLIAAFECKEFKKRNGDTGKAAASDAPSWVKNEGHKPCKNPNEDGKAFAKRLLDVKYGPGEYKTGADSEHNKIQKYGDRSFE